MTLFFVRLPYRSNAEPSPRKRFLLNQSNSEQAERRQRQVVKHLREVKANYSWERRIFF
jgi:hypothetical protein